MRISPRVDSWDERIPAGRQRNTLIAMVSEEGRTDFTHQPGAIPASPAGNAGESERGRPPPVS